MAAAMPPCAYIEFDSVISAFVKIVTRAVSARSIAARKPAIPLPMTRKSVRRLVSSILASITRLASQVRFELWEIRTHMRWHNNLEARRTLQQHPFLTERQILTLLTIRRRTQ